MWRHQQEQESLVQGEIKATFPAGDREASKEFWITHLGQVLSKLRAIGFEVVNANLADRDQPVIPGVPAEYVTQAGRKRATIVFRKPEVTPVNRPAVDQGSAFWLRDLREVLLGVG